MRFDELPIGTKFVHASDAQKCGVFEKKSLSSAYTLNAKTLERQKFDNYVRESCGFSGCVTVYALYPVTKAAKQMDMRAA